MNNTLYNPYLSWYKMPEAIEYIKILQDQGVSTFDPVSFYKEAKISNIEKINVKNLSKKDRKKLGLTKVSKSGEKIIRQNLEKKENDLKDEENRKIDHWVDKCNKINEMCNLISRMRTDFGRIKSKVILLNKSLNNNLSLESHLLFFSLKDEVENNELSNLVNQAINAYKQKYLNDDLIEIQMCQLSSYLNPLNPLNMQKKKLDDWQVDVFQKIENKEDILIVAPTSAGKTVCSTYCAIVCKKTLFVVPSDELARQVAGIFRNMKDIMIGIITNKEYYEDSNANVIIGTPKRLEEYLINHLHEEDKCNFEYVIYDEIQMLNSEEGAAFENIIKLLNIPSLFLSATIYDPNELKNWLETIKEKEVNLVSYKKRFIVQQRYLWQENKLNHLHPLSCMNADLIASGILLNSDMSFTPRDTYHLYNTIKSLVNDEDVSMIKPHNILNKGLWDSINLNDTIIVEKKLKTYLTELSINNVELTNQILNNYNVNEINSEINIVELIKSLIDRNMCPAIFFKLDAFKCKSIFKYVVEELERLQNIKYPYHYDDLTVQYEAMSNFKKLWEAEKEKIVIPKNIDPDSFIENMKKKCEEKHLNQLKTKFTQIINSRNEKITKNNEMTNEKKEFYIKHYIEKLNTILGHDELQIVDKNMPHKEFTFNYMGVDSNMMRGIRRELKKNLGYDVKYSHPIMIGIERGIVPYFRDMEVPFQRIVQSLFAQKKIPIIISDESLGYGINMPIRTVVMLGNENIEEIDPLKANQMSGRSGRRGIDREGNIVYAGVNWKNILRGSFPELTGVNPISTSLPLPIYFNKLTTNEVDRLFKITLYQFKNNQIIDNKENIMDIIATDTKYKTEMNSELMWSCRYYNANYKFIPEILDNMISNKVLNDLHVFSYLAMLFDEGTPLNNNQNLNFDTSSLFSPNTLISVYKEKRILNNESSQNIFNRLKKIGSALASIEIIIRKYKKFRNVDKVFIETFKNIKSLTDKYQF